MPGAVELLVEVGPAFQMLRLEILGPQHVEQLVLALLGVLLLVGHAGL